MKTIYTIGYSGFRDNLNAFINALEINSVSVLIDVRSNPHSSQFPDFNKECLTRELQKRNIIYRNYASEFGAQQYEKNNYSKAKEISKDEQYPIVKSNRVDKESLNADDEIIDYDKFIETQSFISGVEKLNEIYKKNHKVVLMCSEKDPINCHRAIMVSKGLFYDYHFEIKHIIPNSDGTIIMETQRELEKRLIDEFDKKNAKQKSDNQLNLFNAVQMPIVAKPIESYYKRKNILIGWKFSAVSNKKLETV